MKVVQISALTFAIQSFVTLFVIMDPPGATPIFLALVAHKSPKERRILAVKAAAVSFSPIHSQHVPAVNIEMQENDDDGDMDADITCSRLELTDTQIQPQSIPIFDVP